MICISIATKIYSYLCPLIFGLVLSATAFAALAQTVSETAADVITEDNVESEGAVAPAIIVSERPSEWGEPTEVKIMIAVIDIDAVDSANQNFAGSVYIEARWSDPSLIDGTNKPRIAPLTAIWTPRLSIVNSQQTWSAYPSFVEIMPDGEVIYRQKFWGWFSQTLDLRSFPLDRQTLHIHVVAAGLLQTEVAMTPLIRPGGRSSAIAEEFSLPDFGVVSWVAASKGYYALYPDAPAVAGFAMEIVIQRNPQYYFWRLVMPLCLIVIMSWVPRWLSIKEVGTSIGIAATSFLTLVAYLFATALLLPRFSYLTRMDVFILSATLIVFLSLLQTVMTSFVASSSKGIATVSLINRWSRVVYPIILVGVLYMSFGI